MDVDSFASHDQRKIELQSPEDLAYLVANVRRVAASRLAEAFPQVDGEDALRNEIEAHVNDYITKTFTLAAPSLSINGLSVPPDQFVSSTAPEAYQPFDTKKRQRVAELTAQEEKLLKEVAALKRSVPAAAAEEQARRLDEAMKRDEAAFAKRAETMAASASEGVDVALDPLDRQAGVEDRFSDAVGALTRLKSDMPAVVARMGRARDVGNYVVKESK